MKYTKEQFLKAAEIGEVSMIDAKHIVSLLDEVIELPQQEISDESWEGCDGCTDQDEVMYKNGYVKGYNAAIADLPKEISDEEIREQAIKYDNGAFSETPIAHFMEGAFWYREQLKQR